MKWYILASLLLSSFANAQSLTVIPNFNFDTGVRVSDYTKVLKSPMLNKKMDEIEVTENISCSFLDIKNKRYKAAYHFKCTDIDLQPVLLIVNLEERHGGIAFINYEVRR